MGHGRNAAVTDLGAVDPEVLGLLALMLLQESRRAARTSPAGGLVLLELFQADPTKPEQLGI